MFSKIFQKAFGIPLLNSKGTNLGIVSVLNNMAKGNVRTRSLSRPIKNPAPTKLKSRGLRYKG